ncbi:unnamed protein product [Cladocopium goreaui]|uniref:Protein xylosyltransferase n=1 Tax=Cladocopium goreaui TaxID=2562237 RepID=A0A9P1FPN5_9DINO|nr:unnamed protein product [Cladocopium goreaui]
MPLKILLDSMRAIRFANFSDVIVVVGGADSDRIYTDNDMVYIETPFENYDLTGLSMLWHYRQHPYVLANVYLYLLDTSTVGAGFPEKFRSLGNVEQQEYRAVNRPASNICAFGRGVLEKFKTNFDEQLSKDEGLQFEFGQSPKGVKQIEAFAQKVTELRPRVDHGEPVDIYQTGHPRRVYWYPDFDILKYIFIGGNGDVTGTISQLKCCPLLQALHRKKKHHKAKKAKKAKKH